MYKKVIEIFKKITQIPHCSGNTEKLQDFIEEYAKKRDFERPLHCLCKVKKSS